MKPQATRKLPHYSRFFSAYFFKAAFWLIIWLLFASLLAVNISARINSAVPDKIKVAAIIHPGSEDAHLRLARIYWISGDQISSVRETRLAIQFSGESANTDVRFPPKPVLGASSDTIVPSSGLQDEITGQLSAYAFWKSVAVDRPDYVSARIAAASYAYMLGKYAEADNFISDALFLDPTNQEAISLAEQITIR
jgi:hypothetical protein